MGPDFCSCPIHQVLDDARRAGVRYLLLPGRADQVLVWGPTTAAADRAVDVLRRRRDEVAAFLGSQRPALHVIGDDEPDIPVADLPWSVLRSMIVATILETLEIECSTEAWERGNAGRDASPAPPNARKMSGRERDRTDRVRF